MIYRYHTALDKGIFLFAPVLKLVAIIMHLGILLWGCLKLRILQDITVTSRFVNEVKQIVVLNVPANRCVELWAYYLNAKYYQNILYHHKRYIFLKAELFIKWVPKSLMLWLFLRSDCWIQNCLLYWINARLDSQIKNEFIVFVYNLKCKFDITFGPWFIT